MSWASEASARSRLTPFWAHQSRNELCADHPIAGGGASCRATILRHSRIQKPTTAIGRWSGDSPRRCRAQSCTIFRCSCPATCNSTVTYSSPPRGPRAALTTCRSSSRSHSGICRASIHGLRLEKSSNLCGRGGIGDGLAVSRMAQVLFTFSISPGLIDRPCRTLCSAYSARKRVAGAVRRLLWSRPLTAEATGSDRLTAAGLHRAGSVR
jgi:hypothetical protein